MGNSGRNWGKCMPPTHSFAIEKIFAKNDFIKKYKWTIGESQSQADNRVDDKRTIRTWQQAYNAKGHGRTMVSDILRCGETGQW